MKTLNGTFLLFSIVCSASAAVMPSAFIGTYKSDKETTLARWKAERRFGEKTDRAVEVFSKILGRHIITLSESSSVSYKDGLAEPAEPYVGVMLKDGLLYLTSYSKTWKRNLTSRLELADDGYWIYSEDLMPGYCGRYRKAKLPNQALEPTTPAVTIPAAQEVVPAGVVAHL